MKNLGFLYFAAMLLTFCVNLQAATNHVLVLDGVNDYLEIKPTPAPNHVQIGTNDFTVEAWIKIEAYNPAIASQSIFSQVSGVGQHEVQPGIEFFVRRDQNLYLRLLGGPSVVSTSKFSNALSPGSWVHVAVSADRDGLAYFYINGEHCGGQDISAGSGRDLGNFNSPRNPKFDAIGASPVIDGGIDKFLNGCIDEVRIWTHAFADCEIERLMHLKPTGTEQDLIAHWNFDNGDTSDRSNPAYDGTLENGATTLAEAVSETTEVLYTAVEIEFDTGFPTTMYQLQSTTNLSDPVWANVGDSVHGNGGKASVFDSVRSDVHKIYRVVSYASLPATNLQEGLVADYPFNGNADDATGNGHDGVVNGATLTTDRFNNLNSAYQFTNGSQTWIQIPTAPDLELGDNFTINAWFNADEWVHQPGIVCKRNGFSGRDWQIWYNEGAPSGLNFDGGNPNVQLRGRTIPTGSWHMVTVVRNGDSWSQFVNGELDVENNLATTLSTGDPILIGRLGLSGAAGDYRGKIDDVRIYSRSLSSNEVSQLYALPAP